MSGKPRSTAIWATRRDMSGCYVRCAADDVMEIWVPAYPGSAAGRVVDLPRGEARLLARRINQCLDATVKR